MTPQNIEESFFDFTFKSSVLTAEGGIACVCLCLFFSENVTDERAFNVRLAGFVKNYNYTSDVENGVINRLIIILPETEDCKTYSRKEFFQNEDDKIRFSILLSAGKPVFLLYDKDGIWHNGNASVMPPRQLSNLFKEIKLKGLYHIFECGNGILESGPSHHYILQNEFHADKFIRTANILTNSKYIDFIAVFLLNFINESDKRVYIDTSGIASLVYSINKIKNIFTSRANLTILSFNSYSGISSLINDASTKIIISASTSGGLSKKLMEYDFLPDKILILFYLNPGKPTVKVLCDLFEFNEINKTRKYSYFTVENEASCSFCAHSSYPIKIVGEQFLPEELRVDTFGFDVSDRPLWLTKFVKEHFHQDIFKAHHNELNSDSNEGGMRKREVFIHFEKVFKNMIEKQKKLKRFFSSKLPNKIDALIYYPDQGSIYLRDLIVKQYDKNILSDNIISDNDINLKKKNLENKNILVVSSTINSGRQLVETSLKLRETNCNGICYFIGISRTPDEYTIDITRKYIGFDNDLGKDINPLIIVDSIYVSDINITSTFTHASVSSWEDEQKIFQEIKTAAQNSELFDSRIKELTAGSLTDNLYWGDCNNNKLQLRPNFAFYLGTGLDKGKSTQAEVFFLINTVLHNIRRNPNKKILQSVFHRHVIAPETFIMYNDGIIQASILRSATNIELNYNFFGNNLKIATEMLNVLKYVFNNFNHETGEATVEFLIALCTKRLQVIKKELDTIIQNLEQKVTTSDVKNKELILALCGHIKKDLKKESK
ncbi:MAG: hypothetical protein ACJ75B_18595 [Flavisolibacter sp.]